GQQRDLAWADEASLCEQLIALEHIFPASPHVSALYRWALDLEAIVVFIAVLLHDTRVGSLGNEAAGEKTDGFAGLQRLRSLAGKATLLNRQALARGVIGVADGVAVHRTVVGGWQVAGGEDGLGQDAATGLGERAGLRDAGRAARGGQAGLCDVELKHGSGCRNYRVDGCCPAGRG